MAQYQQVQGPQAFASGLFGCFDDFGTCLEGYFCPCISMGRTAAANEGQQETVNWMCCVLGALFGVCVNCKQRGDVRQKYGIAGGACGDFCTAFCCGACSVCQLMNEHNRRGTKTGALCIEPSLSPQQMK